MTISFARYEFLKTLTEDCLKRLDELSAPRDIQRKYLEKDIQKQCVGWMRSRGYWARKFSSQSQRSVPDYLFALKTDRLGEYGWVEKGATKLKFFCEFKREGAKVDPETGCMSTKAQVEEQNAMRAVGWDGFECDDVEKFKAWVLAYEADNA